MARFTRRLCGLGFLPIALGTAHRGSEMNYASFVPTSRTVESAWFLSAMQNLAD
jgi:hypothetical protein